jgi:MFS family permease
MGAVIPRRMRGSDLGARKMAMATASAVLVPFAGWIIDRIGEPAGFQVGLTAGFVLGVISAIFIWLIPEAQVKASIEEQRDGGTLREALSHSKVFRRYILIRLFWSFSHQIGGPFFPVYQREVLLTPMQLIGLLITVSSITRMIGQRFWGKVVDVRGARWVLGICSLTIPALPFIWIFVTRPWHVVFVSLPSGFLWAGFQMGALALLLNLPAANDRTQAAAAHATAVRMGNIAGPLVGNLIIQQLGYRWNFAFSGIGRLIAALLFVALLRPFGKAVVDDGTRLSQQEASDQEGEEEADG